MFSDERSEGSSADASDDEHLVHIQSVFRAHLRRKRRLDAADDRYMYSYVTKHSPLTSHSHSYVSAHANNAQLSLCTQYLDISSFKE